MGDLLRTESGTEFVRQSMLTYHLFSVPPPHPVQHSKKNPHPQDPMSSESDISFLDNLPSHLLNDFRDEVPEYAHNKHRI